MTPRVLCAECATALRARSRGPLSEAAWERLSAMTPMTLGAAVHGDFTCDACLRERLDVALMGESL